MRFGRGEKYSLEAYNKETDTATRLLGEADGEDTYTTDGDTSAKRKEAAKSKEAAAGIFETGRKEAGKLNEEYKAMVGEFKSAALELSQFMISDLEISGDQTVDLIQNIVMLGEDRNCPDDAKEEALKFNKLTRKIIDFRINKLGMNKGEALQNVWNDLPGLFGTERQDLIEELRVAIKHLDEERTKLNIEVALAGQKLNPDNGVRLIVLNDKIKDLTETFEQIKKRKERIRKSYIFHRR